MEIHSSNLCSSTFSNGRPFGAHIKSHLTSFSHSQQVAETVKTSDEKVFVLRENPKRSFKVADPEFSFTVDGESSVVVIQDRESETESKRTTKRRSKRTRKPVNFESKKLRFKQTILDVSPEQPVSSVSDTSSDEDVALCLVMLSRDSWSRTSDQDQERSSELVEESKTEIKNLKCDECNNKFRSSQAVTSHKKICPLKTQVAGNGNSNSSVIINSSNERIFECPYCYKIFGSGQALGGHKRSHLISSATSGTRVLGSAKVKVEKNSLFDLNKPAPEEENEISVVSEA